MAAAIRIDEDTVRRWLVNLRRPDRLDDRALSALLRAHGRSPGGPGLRAGRAGAEFLREKIESLRPPDGAPPGEATAHRVLTTCFVEGRKSFQAAALLGLSERQISRERSRAIALLTAELRGAAPDAALPLVPPAELIPRPDLERRLDAAAGAARRVHMTGCPGAGKTVLVEAWADGRDGGVFRHAFAPALDDGLTGLLFALGDDLAPRDPTLRAYMQAALPRPDLGLAARIALAALRREPHLLVLDDFDAAAGRALEGFLYAAARLPSATIVTVGRRPAAGAIRSVAVPELTEDEVVALLRLRGFDEDAAAPLHAWTGGNPRLVDTAVAWLAAPDAPPGPLLDAAAEDATAVRTAARLMWSARGGARRPPGRRLRAGAGAYGTRSVSSIS